MKINFKIKLTPKQQEAYNALFADDTRVLTCRWSRQSGKTVFAMLACMRYLLDAKKAYVGYLTPTFALSRKVYKEILSLLQQTNLVRTYNSTTLTITMENGNTMQFFSVEAYKSIRGNTIQGLLVIDEAAYMPDTLPNGESLWSNVVQPITKARKPKILIISTPCGRDGFFYDYFNKGLENKEYKCITATIWDDPNITEEEILKIKSEIAPLAFQQEYEVEFLSNSLTVFPDFEYQFKKLSEIDYNDTLWAGLDLSTVGEDNTILTLINKRNEVFQFKIDGELDIKYLQISNILNKCKKLVKVYVETNGVGEPMLNEIKKMVIYKSKIEEWTTTNDSKGEIIGLLQNKIAQKDIWFDKDNLLLYNEFGTFIYTITKSRKITYGAKPGKHDDTVLSLAIALKAKDDVVPLNTQRDVKFIRSKDTSIR